MFKRLEMLLGRGIPSLRVLSIEDGAGTEGAGGGESAVEMSTAERALEFWDKPEGDADDQGGQQDDAEGGDGAGDEGAGEDDAAGDEKSGEDEQSQLTDEQLQADPRYQELSKFQTEHKPVLDKYGVPDAKELDLQLADSAVLYSIMQGKGTPSQLLDTMAQAAHWSKEQQQAVAQDLIGWLTKAGYLKDGQAGQQRGNDGKFKDPLETRLDQIERERKEDRDRQTQAAEQQRQSKIFDKYKAEVNRLCAEKGIDKADFDFIGREIRALVTPQEFKSFVDAIEKDNFVKVRELFAKVHNREVERLKRFNSSLTKTHERRQRSTPRSPAGGAPPAPAGQQKRNLSNRDERLAAASAEWDK